MKKIVFISIAVLFMTISANAQLFQYGLKAGVNFSSIAMDDVTGITDGTQVYDLVTGETVAGYQFGLMTRLKVAMVFVQPELYFNTTGGTVEQVIQGGATEVLNVKFNRIDIPVLVGVKLGPARLNAGPVGSIVISSVNELTEAISEIESVQSGMTFGFQAGIGVDLFSKLTVDARYEGSLSKYADTFTVGGSDYNLDARPNAWILALGYWF
ncbi:MAG: porin family protein [Bacteroidales bacterium]